MKKYIKEFLLIVIGTFAMSLGYSFLLVPNNIASGGASGVAIIFHSVLGLPVALTVLAINVVLFGVSFRMVPVNVLVKSFVGTVLLTFFLEITSSVLPFTDDVLLASTFGGVLVGVGVGVVIRCGASTGGSDFLAILLCKLFKKRLSVATLILIIDGIIIVSAGIVYADYTLMLYTVISAYITSRLADSIIEGGNSAKSVYVISEKSEEISSAIINDLKRGVTGIYGRGMYTGRDTTMILCIVMRNEIPKLRSLVKKIDKDAFIILSDVREVLGEGF